MHIEDLPRLTDEERDALDCRAILDDGYVAIEGVAAPAAVPFGAGPMPLWVLATLIVATILINASWSESSMCWRAHPGERNRGRRRRSILYSPGARGRGFLRRASVPVLRPSLNRFA